MKLKDRFRFVRQNMKKNRSRVFMTVLATAMGCSFLIVLASVGFGLQKSVVQEITEGRLMTDINVYGKKDEKNNYSPLTVADIDALEKLPNVKSVTRRQFLQQSPIYKLGERSGPGQTLVAHMPSEIKAGFELSAGRMPQADNEVIVGYNFAEFLRLPGEQPADSGEDAAPKPTEPPVTVLNKTIEMEIKQFVGKTEQKKTIPVTVVGVSKALTREWMKDGNVYISEGLLKQIEAFTGTPRGMIQPQTENGDGAGRPNKPADTYDDVHVYANDVEDVKAIVKQMTDGNYTSHSIVNELEQVNVMFTIMKIGLLLVGTIAVLIASIGIYNTMTMAVTERAQDIGIMKAIGAHPSTIKSVFLIESGYIGILGAIIGTAVSYVISFAVNLSLPAVISGFLGETPPEGLIFSDIPLLLTLICVGISLLV
ncbi:ABC transporter permease, partial [Paenibacillus sp. HJGM_3]|uniref:ABC transporter permease n=1 Tax=Paenibacillus sp. HJGM_3 TaxID=3379816 RepID=UPI00385D83C7